jgi:hypothetical protein
MTIPTPTVRKNASQRTVKLNYATGVEDAEGVRVAQVFAYHNKERKFFTASLNLVTVKTENGYSTEGFFPFDAVRLISRPVARYSEKAFDAFVNEVREFVVGLVDPTDVAYNPKAVAIFSGCAE